MTAINVINAWICQVEENNIIPRFGDLTVTDGRITDVRLRSYPQFITPDVNSINAAGRVLLPPFVNFHDHIYSRLAKGLPTSGAMNKFTDILENLWWPLDRALDADMITACANLAIAESLRYGVTYIFDHHVSPNATTGSLDLIAAVMRECGLRGVLSFETSDRNGIKSGSEALAENHRFITQSTDDNIQGMLGLHALFTLSDDTLAATRQMINELSTAIHIHLAEDKHDGQFCRQQFGLSLTERLKKFDLLNDRTILAHGNYLEPGDYRAIAAAGSALVYNPDSNLNNAVGLPHYANVPAEISILAGTDGMHANVPRSQKQLFLLYRMQGNSFDASFAWLRRIWFDQFHFVKKWFADYPALQNGDRADLVILDYIPPTPLNEKNFWGHYIYGILESPAHTVLQQGKILLAGGQLTSMNYEKLMVDIYLQGKRLFQRVQEP